jgi:hypothetical protein
MGVAELFVNNLRNSGIQATIDSGNQSLLSKLNMFGAKLMGRIVLQGRQIDEIELFGHYDTHDSDVGYQSRRTTLTAVDVDYILNADFTGRKQLLEAKLKVKRSGLIHRKVEEMHWEGNVLANMLNKDTSINQLLAQSIGLLSARDIEIKPDEGQNRIEIHVRDDRQVFNGDLPPILLYERIAEYIYALLGIAKTIAPAGGQPQSSPAPPPEVQQEPAPVQEAPPEAAQQPSPVQVQEAPAASAPIPQASPPIPEIKPPAPGAAIIPGVKYCYKCGARMPEDSNFCPKCGIRQD